MKEIVSIFLAFQVLLSSMSFNIGMHFCGDKLQSFSLFDKATPCQHAFANSEAHACPFHAKKQNSKKGCCGDKEVVIKGQEHLSILSSYTVNLAPTALLPLAIFTFTENIWNAQTGSLKSHNYKPPLKRVDIAVAIQTFLI
tara:strand:- start:438 stop:860 length:423 start_codon:yes stop_codon:yes gene_type:complete